MRYTIRAWGFVPASRLSVYLSNNALGHCISYPILKALGKLIGYKARKRYRMPVEGRTYARGGSLKREYAKCFAVYFDIDKR